MKIIITSDGGLKTEHDGKMITMRCVRQYAPGRIKFCTYECPKLMEPDIKGKHVTVELTCNGGSKFRIKTADFTDDRQEN